MTNTGVVKIIDLLNRPRSEGDKIAVSLEYFPPRSAEGVEVRTMVPVLVVCLFVVHWYSTKLDGTTVL